MAIDKTTAGEDLAFIRQLLSSDGSNAAEQRGFGVIYAAWGAAFAVPLFLEWMRMAGLIGLPGWFWPAAAAAATVAIIAVTILVSRRAPPTVGVQNRAANAVFGGVGWANLAVLLALLLAAGRLQDGRIMMLHGVVVFAFQGAAWYAVWALRKRAWTGLVAAGWFVFAAALGATLPSHWFVLLASAGLFLLMVVPGWVMVRTAARAG